MVDMRKIQVDKNFFDEVSPIIPEFTDTFNKILNRTKTLNEHFDEFVYEVYRNEFGDPTNVSPEEIIEKLKLKNVLITILKETGEFAMYAQFLDYYKVEMKWSLLHFSRTTDYVIEDDKEKH